MNPFEKSQCSFVDALEAVNALEELRHIGIITDAEAREGLNEIRRQLGLPPLEQTKNPRENPE